MGTPGKQTLPLPLLCFQVQPPWGPTPNQPHSRAGSLWVRCPALAPPWAPAGHPAAPRPGYLHPSLLPTPHPQSSIVSIHPKQGVNTDVCLERERIRRWMCKRKPPQLGWRTMEEDGAHWQQAGVKPPRFTAPAAPATEERLMGFVMQTPPQSQGSDPTPFTLASRAGSHLFPDVALPERSLQTPPHRPPPTSRTLKSGAPAGSPPDRLISSPVT